MASRAVRLGIIFSIGMTIGAIHRQMCLVQFQTGRGMLKIILIPSAMTGLALVAESGDFLPRRMTGLAIQPVMISVKRPTGAFMRESRAFTIIVALLAFVLTMAIVAHAVYLLFTLHQGRRLLQVMAVTAVLFLVAVNTSEPEQDNMLFMLESNNRTAGQRRMINLVRRFRDYRVGSPHNIGRI